MRGHGIDYRAYLGIPIGRLTPIAYEKRSPTRDNGDAVPWFKLRCECDGREIWRRAYLVVKHNTQSCGCLRREMSKQRMHARNVARVAHG